MTGSFGIVGLHQHPARLVATAGAPGDLLDLLEAALGSAKVAAGKAEVRIDHADQGQVGKVIALRDQLRADDDVDRVRFHLGDELRGARGRPDRVGCDDGRPRFGEQRGDFVGDALDAGPAGDQAVFLAAFRAGLGRRHHMAAMVAGEAVHQPVLDHPGGAIRALEAMPAMAAQGQRREAAAVEEQQATARRAPDWLPARRPGSAPASARAAAGPAVRSMARISGMLAPAKRWVSVTSR